MEKTSTIEGFGKRFKQKVAFVLMVVVIPIVALLLMGAIALQVVGVPVWNTAMKWLNPPNATHQVTATAQAKTSQSQAKQIKALEAQVKSLKAQLVAAQQQYRTLAVKQAQLQQEVLKASSTLNQAKPEAAVLNKMNPQSAAAVLGKMTTVQAAAVIAAMTPSEAGPILNNMKPTNASKLLIASAQSGALNTVQISNNTTGSTTTPVNGTLG